MEDKDKAIEELLDSMEEEYLKGARAMLNHIRERVTGCNGRDGCSVCVEAKKFFHRHLISSTQTHGFQHKEDKQ